MPVHPMPLVRIEIVLQSVIEERLATLLIRRAEAPYQGRWAIPGGVIRVDKDADLDRAAARVAAERLGIDGAPLEQMCAVGARDRDPRAAQGWALSVVYRALLSQAPTVAGAGKRVQGLRWLAADDSLPHDRLAFDHGKLSADAAAQTRARVAALEFPRGFAPPRFTLGELQRLCEQVLGASIDKSSFRRKLRDRGLVEPIAGAELRGLPHRPSAIYRWIDPRGPD